MKTEQFCKNATQDEIIELFGNLSKSILQQKKKY